MTGASRIIILFVLTVSLSGYTFAGTPCSQRSPGYKAAGEDFYEPIKTKLKDIAAGESTIDITDVLRQKSKVFLNAAKTHCNGTVNETWSHDIFIKLIEFSLKNATILKDIMQKDLFKCVRDNKIGIKACNASSSKNNTLWGRLSGRSHLTFNDVSCPQTQKNKNCVLKVLEPKCDPIVVDYVDSLFAFMQSNYCNNLRKKSSGKSSASASGGIPGCLAAISSVFIVEMALTSF